MATKKPAGQAKKKAKDLAIDKTRGGEAVKGGRALSDKSIKMDRTGVIKFR